MSFGENLQALRKKNQLSQEALAEMLGVSRQAVSKWELGDGYPEVEKLLFLSKKLNVSLDSLLETGSTSAVCDRPSTDIMVVSPDKRKMLSCQRGVSASGCMILVQLENDSETLCCYKTSEEAMAALQKIREAMLKGIPYLEL